MQYPKQTAEQYEIRVDTSEDDAQVVVVPPGSAPSFALSPGHAIVLGVRLQAAGEKALKGDAS